MEKAYSRIDWENKPSTKTAVNEANLNRMDSAIDVIDNRVISLDLTKAKQSDMLESVKSIEYNETTGLFVFTWHNGTSKEVDLNIEKIPVSFSMSSDGIITMVTSDGTEYTADIGSLITNYDFEDTPVITFSKRTAQDGTEVISANIPDGSITGNKLQPNYLADVTVQAANALRSETNAGLSEIKAKGSEDRAKQYADQAAATDVGQLIPRVAALEIGKADETEVSAIKESLIQYEQSGFLSRNLYDESKKTTGIFADNGDFNSSTSGSYASDYIEVSEGSYVLSFTRNDTEVYTRIIGFKANKEKATNPLLKKDTDVTLGKKVNMFTVPSEVKYIRFNYSNKSTDVQLEKGTVAHDWTPYSIGNQGLTQIVEGAIDGGYIRGNNLANPNSNEKLNASTTGTAYRVGQLFDGGKTYYISKSSSTSEAFYYQIYNTNKTPKANGVGITTTVASVTVAENELLFVRNNYENKPLGEGVCVSLENVPYVEYVPSNSELKQSLAQLTTPTYINSANISRYISAVNPSVVDFVGGNDNFITICGNVVTISLRIRVLQAISASTKIFTIDNSIKPFGFSQSSNGIAFPLVKTWDRTDMAFATISNFFDGIALIGAHPTGDYLGTITYIKA